jgi:hypothetical protein
MSLVSAGLRQQILASYVAQYQSSSPSSTETDSRAWIAALPLIPSPTKALETATYAVSLARLGATLHAPDIQRESLKLYTQSLRRTQMALWDRRLMYSDETLAACMLLAIYEVYECPGRSRAAYINHFNGCAKLIQLRGPAAHTDGLAHAIFQGFRLMGVSISSDLFVVQHTNRVQTLDALELKPSFLTDPKWKTVPFSSRPKAPFQKVLDVFLEGPNIIEKGNSLANIPIEKRVPFIIDMIQDCISLDNKMQQFLLDFEASEGGLLYWAVPTRPSNIACELDFPVDNDRLFTLSYEFSNVRIGATMMLSWAGLTILWSGLCQLYQTLGHFTTITPATDGKLEGSYTLNGQSHTFRIPSPERFTEFPTMARNVCQSVEFSLGDDMNLPIMIGPLNMVIDAWISWPAKFDREIAWAKNMLLYIHNRGSKISKYGPQTLEVF